MKEGQSLEFKSEIPKSFLKTVSAYANCGTGIIRIKEAYRGQGASPCLEIGENSVKVTLPVIGIASSAATPGGRQALSALQGGQLLSSGELGSRLGLDRGKVPRVIKALREKGLVRIEGKGRGTRYSGQPQAPGPAPRSLHHKRAICAFFAPSWCNPFYHPPGC